MLNISCGIPQGSVLGPLFVKRLTTVEIADNINIIYSGNTIDDVDVIINMELKNYILGFKLTNCHWTSQKVISSSSET